MIVLLLTMLAAVAAAVFSTWYLKNEADADWKARREAWERHPSYRHAVRLRAYDGWPSAISVHISVTTQQFAREMWLATEAGRKLVTAGEKPPPPGRHRAPRWWERRS